MRRLVSLPGDTVASLQKHALRQTFSHLSLAGGGFVQWLSGEPSPGVEVLRRFEERPGEQSRFGGTDGRGTAGCDLIA